jgi:glycosyltransferase involved in cell wall biosynthesis
LQSSEEIRKELGIEPSAFVVGSVGRLVEVKNYPCLVRAFHLFSKNRPDVRLLLVGEGPERGTIEQMIDEHALQDKVILVGRREDVPALLSAMNVFVLPSFREGLSNTILEAMCAGLPTIASNVGGNPELIVPGIAGELFECDNERELSTYLEQCYSNPQKREQMSIAAREHVERNFTLDSMVEKYENAYLRLMGNPLPVQVC